MMKIQNSMITHTIEVMFLNKFLFLMEAYTKHKNIDVKNKKDIISRKSIPASYSCA